MKDVYNPGCSLPQCDNPVGSHITHKNGNRKYKQFCEFHRKKGNKFQVDKFKLDRGCEGDGKDPCTSTIKHPVQLTIDHNDGNNRHRDESNIKVRCANCHALKTHRNGDHSKQYNDLKVEALAIWVEVDNEEKVA